MGEGAERGPLMVSCSPPSAVPAPKHRDVAWKPCPPRGIAGRVRQTAATPRRPLSTAPQPLLPGSPAAKQGWVWLVHNDAKQPTTQTETAKRGSLLGISQRLPGRGGSAAGAGGVLHTRSTLPQAWQATPACARRRPPAARSAGPRRAPCPGAGAAASSAHPMRAAA